MIAIVDYGVGNLGSIANMFKRLAVPVAITASPDEVEAAERLVLPGVGHFDHGMRSLRARGFADVLSRRVAAGVPLLGICLGAQLMTKSSEEGDEPGLGWLDVTTVRFDRARMPPRTKVPHMGWTDVAVARASPLFPDAAEESRFYFVHSFHFACAAADDVMTTSVYGYPFVSSFARGNLFGVQFHPEKSHRFGMRLLKRFAEVRP